MRLSKFIASSGYASRRKSDSLIENGFVIVNNEVCRDFSTQVLEGDEVIVENTKISLPKPKIYSFYKPKNCLCTSKDPEGRRTIYDVLGQNYKNLITIGRLDFKSEGLLLLTNNGEIARYYELPRNNIKRTYLVDFEGNYKKSFSQEMVSGIKFRGIKYSVSKSKLIKIKGQRFTLELTLSEGKNREIRNIAKYFNWNVFKLKRISHGEYNLSSLKSSQLREEKISKNISNNILDIDE
tara:strand:- start:1259 stop:1972 length:714 start_codon:yes stop_codon:yes gene_type:complete